MQLPSFRIWMKRPSVRVAVALAVLAAIGVAIGTALTDDDPAPLSPVAAAVVPMPAPMAANELPVHVADNPPPAQTSHGEDEVEVCGVGWVAAAPTGTPDEATLLAAPGIAPARRDIGASLSASSDEFGRAVALWVGAIDDPSLEARRNLLAREATATSDPRVYALAFRYCLGKTGADGACAMLTAEQWARLDPGNAMPWLYALDAAVSRHDTAARDEAIYQISVAPRIEDRMFAAPAAIVNHAPDDDRSALAAWTLAVQVLGMSAAQTMPLQTLMQSCGRADLADANRRQVCSAIADLLTHRSDSFLLQTIGGGLGRRLGNDAEALDKSRTEVNALLMATISTSLACADVRRELQRFQRGVQIGELGAMREQVSSATVYSAAPPAR